MVLLNMNDFPMAEKLKIVFLEVPTPCPLFILSTIKSWGGRRKKAEKNQSIIRQKFELDRGILWCLAGGAGQSVGARGHTSVSGNRQMREIVF